MRLTIRPWWASAAVALTVAACGAEPDRYSLRTPGANTGDPNVAPLATTTPGASVTPTPTPTATPKPKAAKKAPVTKAEKRVIKGWSDELRHGHVTAAARYFSLPSLVSNGTPGFVVLDSLLDVKTFNAGLPCGAKLIATRRSVEHFVVGTFKLTERPGRGECGTGTGSTVAVAFMIRNAHITHWVRDDSLSNPSATATPTPTPDASVTPTPTATATATPTGTPTPSPTPISTTVAVPGDV